jgi:hypothetical protein
MSFFSNLIAQGEEMLEHAAPGKLDHYFADLKQTVGTKTHALVYDACHERNIHEPIRSIIEGAIEHLPVRTPKVLAGPLVALLNRLEFKVYSCVSDFICGSNNFFFCLSYWLCCCCMLCGAW